MPKPLKTSAASTVDRALTVLAVLAQAGRALTAGELMRKAALSQSTLYRQLAALKRWGFVIEVEGRYAPGPLSLQLALGFDMASHVVHSAHAEMQEISEQSHETVGLLVAVNGQAICIDMVESPHALRCSFEKGRSVPLHRGASARCLMAHLGDTALAQLVATQPQVPEFQTPQFRDDLAHIRNAGYATSSGEVDPGVWGVSAPLFGMHKHAVAALTLMAPSQRAQGRQDQLIQMTVVGAARISRSLRNPA